jgi:diguanylate cyclase (GGDEF)-like protein
VQTLRPDAYTEDDVQTLSVIAAQAAVAIENARLYAESQRAVRQNEVLLEVARTITSSLDLPSVLDAILTGMAEVVPYYIAAILLPDRAKGHLDLVGAGGEDAEQRRRNIKIPIGQGITGKAFETGEPILLPDVHRFADYIGGRQEVHSEMAVPLNRGDSVIGVLDVERREIDAFSSEELNLLLLFASQAAIAIENAHLFSEQRDRVFELQTIQSIVQELTALDDAQEIASLINRELRRLIDYHTCRIFLYEPRDQMLHPLLVEPAMHGVRLRMGEGLTGWIALYNQPALVANVLEDSRASYLPGTPLRAESMIGVPLVYEGRVRGVIALTKLGPNQFDENALRLLEIVAAQTAIALDRARLYDELRTQAITDELTKLYNRRYVLERLKEERSRALRNKRSLVAMMIDIDKFKLVNDTYGHDAGDIVLQDLSTVVRAVVRAEDVVSRYGGEEFCVLLPEISLESAVQVAERLRGVIARRRLPDAAGAVRISASLGVALLTPEQDEAGLLSQADRAMYEAKRAGGNRVCAFDGRRYRLFP